MVACKPRPSGHWGRLILTLGLGAGWLLSPPAGAQDGGGRELSLTVYNQDLAVVRDARDLAVEQGTHWLRFQDVPARIDPTSVHLKATDGRRLDVLEQNYLYDLVSPTKIFERYLDTEIKVIVEDGRLYEGKLLSSGGQLVLGRAAGDEGVVILSADKITDIQFPALPEGLITRPTLEWLLEADRGGRRQAEVSYMTGGFNWHAEYVAVVSEDDAEMGFTGWVSVDNRSGATYEDATLQLVAGDVNRMTPPPGRAAAMFKAENAEMLSAAPQFEEETFFEYHLYSMARRTTLRDNETKQLSLFSPTTCKVKKLYESNPRRDAKKVRVVLETTNSEDVGLGMALPKGKVRVYKRDRRDRLQFVGEDGIDHTPRDEKIRVLVGNAFDLVVERTELDRRRLADRVQEVDVKIEVRNRKEDEDVEVVIQEDLYADWTIREANHPYDKKSARRVEFKVPVRAGEVYTVTYTVRFTH